MTKADVDDFPLEEALARYLISKRDELNRKYVEQCIQYRSRNGLGAECPKTLANTAGPIQEKRRW